LHRALLDHTSDALARLAPRPDHPHSGHDPNALFVRLGDHRIHHATFFLEQTLINALATSVSPQLTRLAGRRQR